MFVFAQSWLQNPTDCSMVSCQPVTRRKMFTLADLAPSGCGDYFPHGRKEESHEVMSRGRYPLVN